MTPNWRSYGECRSEAMPNTHVLTIGNANTETVIRIARPLSPGSKVRCQGVFDGIGGSALNWCYWLHSTGTKVHLLCPLGDDDRGNKIRQRLSEAGIESSILPRHQGTTGHSFIIVEQAERSVLKEPGTAVRAWIENLFASLGEIVLHLDSLATTAAMIGNIDVDSSEFDVTPRIVKKLREKGAFLIYANPGLSQYKYCYHHWAKVWEYINVFQLSLVEARRFVGQSRRCEACCTHLGMQESLDEPSLADIIGWFEAAGTTAIVTLGGGGAVAVVRDYPGKLFFVWPRSPTVSRSRVDPTGAGDAFGAGFVWHRLTHRGCRQEDYQLALSTAGVFSTIACEIVGGTGGFAEQPNLLDRITAQDLVRFTEIRSFRDSTELLYLLDCRPF